MAIKDDDFSDMETITRTMESLDYFQNDESDDEEPAQDPRSIKNLSERLLYAAEKDHVDVVREVLDEDPSLITTKDSDGYTPLHRASYNNHAGVVKELLLRGANINSETVDGWHPLHSACRWNCLEVATLLLHNGADINAQTHMGLTALHLAANDKNAKNLLILLLSHPCIDPDIRSHAGEIAYVIACRAGPYAHLFDMVSETVNKL